MRGLGHLLIRTLQYLLQVICSSDALVSNPSKTTEPVLLAATLRSIGKEVDVLSGLQVASTPIRASTGFDTTESVTVRVLSIVSLQLGKVTSLFDWLLLCPV